LDQLITTIETDTGVTTDGVSLIWHDQFLNPESCRKADGSAYTMDNRVYLQDISSVEAQKSFICDKVYFGADQKNDLALSPVAVAFAKQEGRDEIGAQRKEQIYAPGAARGERDDECSDRLRDVHVPIESHVAGDDVAQEYEQEGDEA